MPAPLVLPRRAFLRGALAAGVGLLGAGALAGCDLISGQSDPPAPDPLDGFVAATVALADRYDATIKAVPALAARLTPLREAHRAHARAVAAAIGSPTPRPSAGNISVPSDQTQAIAALMTAERKAQDEAVAATMAATAHLSPLLGSIAAARATHLEALI